MARTKATPPPDGGTVQATVPEPIKNMTGFSSVSEMEENLPENTMQAAEGDEPKKVRKPRRSKEEMAKARGESAAPVATDDPLMQDPIYRKHIEKMRNKSISTTVKGGFDTAAAITQDDEWKLEPEEMDDIDGFSYVCSKKYPVLDPSRHWLSMTLYFFALLGTLIFKRAAKKNAENWMKKLGDLFGFGEEEITDAQELENQKAGSV